MELNAPEVYRRHQDGRGGSELAQADAEVAQSLVVAGLDRNVILTAQRQNNIGERRALPPARRRQKRSIGGEESHTPCVCRTKVHNRGDITGDAAELKIDDLAVNIQGSALSSPRRQWQSAACPSRQR